MLGPRMAHSSVVAALSLILVSAACGGVDDASPVTSSLADAASTETRTAEAVQERWTAYWTSRIASENAGELDREAFSRTATGKAVETQTRRLRNYAEHRLVRVGEPEFRDVEVRVNDGSAMVLACFNADGWTATVDGEPWSAKKYGWELSGSVMREDEDAWFVVDELAAEDIADMGKTC